ncbi:MAG: tRNA (adenosine(37)-N6)-threonylcarbamoyltransferase complex ATPase subunit type 1 TsaE [Candidatus Paceibacterota bacterium]
MTGTANNTKTLEALQAEAADFVGSLVPKEDGATLVTLSGELGAGKTSFTQGLAKALGVTDSITSPTFVLEKVYDLPEITSRGFARLVHIDAYRLEGSESLLPLGVDLLLPDPSNLIILEWPEMVDGQLPSPDVSITITVEPDTTRTISYA